MYNILTERLIRMDGADGSRLAASLPEVYAALVADEVEAFPALRPHQRHAWHSFLVQLGAMAVREAGLAEPPSGADEWRRIIGGLTSEWPDDEPWQLVVDDITRPAFMQPPASSKAHEADFKNTVEAPDELDMLVTSKNHDLKQAMASHANADDWVFALVTLQTMEGYSGRFNYGISRMPSGYGNRPAFSLAPSIQPGRHVEHDLVALLGHRQAILDDYRLSDSGLRLLWVIPWDGAKAQSSALSSMDPYYIEVCRRIRLKVVAERIVAARANADAKRIADVKGMTGDPWAPVGTNPNPRGTPPAFLGPRKFGYERVADGMFSEDWKRPLLLTSEAAGTGGSEEMQLVARGMVRGEGGTEGYHERIVPLRHRTLQVLGSPGVAKQLEDIARERLQQVGTVKNILRHAVATFAARGNSDFNAHRNGQPSPNQLAQTWANRLDDIVDAGFFDDLQDEFDADEGQRDAIRRHWLMNGEDGVIDDAGRILKAAEDALPCPSIHRFRARVNADRVFRGRMRGKGGFAFLFESEEENQA